MEITVISTEIIKPSSPTPAHLHRLNLSLIDQFMPPPSVFTSILLFYPAHGDAQRFWRTNMLSHLLKKSLSEVLTNFYPMAGKFDNNWSILCNDEGVGYIEARVKAPYTLNQLLNNPRGEELNRLLPCDMYGIRAPFDKLAAIQVTVFDACGGMVIGVSLSHALADAASLAMFVKSWAAAARLDASLGNPPEFGFDSLFPPRDIPVPQASDYTEEIARSLLQPKNIISKNFVFHQKIYLLSKPVLMWITLQQEWRQCLRSY